jgi:hypothetical protein
MCLRYRLICPVFAGSAFALLTWIILGDHLPASGFGDYPGPALIFILPGLFAGFAVSGNVHVANIWIAAIGNFVFYSGIVYLLLGFWTRRRAK